MIVGDANLSEIATFLKVGTTALVLAMIEDDELPRDLSLVGAGAVAAQGVAGTCRSRSLLELADGGRMTALDLQWQLLRLRQEVRRGPRARRRSARTVGAEVLRRWEHVLTGLESDPMSLADQLDWVAKYRLFEGYRERDGIGWDDTRFRALDLQYHDLRPEKSLYARLGIERIVERRRGRPRR